jgi:Transglutaminase-like superfamily
MFVHISASSVVETGAATEARAASEPSVKAAGPPMFFLCAHVYCCEFDDGAVLLDLRGDTYLGIDARHLSNLRSRIGNWPESEQPQRAVEPPDLSATEDLIKDLLAREILTTSSTSRKPSPATHPTMALTIMNFRDVHRRIPLAHVGQFLMALLVVAWNLRRNHLPAILAWLRGRQSRLQRGGAAEQENVLPQLASFLWLRTWCYTASRRCLFDSLVLSAYLTRARIPCTFVIGVATKPFLAHAWVQIGESVLNDTAERAHDFRPILSIGGE